MNRDSFETRVLSLWAGTRVPLTRANLMLATGTSRRHVERWLDGMVDGGLVELDSDDSGELHYTVRGTPRAASGPTSVAEVLKLEALGREIGKKPSVALVPRAEMLLGPTAPGQKSIVASAALSFFLGPLGWLYAAPLGEALPAIVVFAILWKLLPAFLLVPLLGVALPVSALAGAAYAWAHNQSGSRTSIGEATKKLKKR